MSNPHQHGGGGPQQRPAAGPQFGRGRRGGMGPVEKPKDFKATMRLLLG